MSRTYKINYTNSINQIGGAAMNIAEIRKLKDDYRRSHIMIDTDYTLLDYHGQLNTGTQFIVPDNIILLMSATCGISSLANSSSWYTGIYDSIFSSEISLEKFFKILEQNKGEYTIDNSQKYGMYNSGERLCDVILSITYDDDITPGQVNKSFESDRYSEINKKFNDPTSFSNLLEKYNFVNSDGKNIFNHFKEIRSDNMYSIINKLKQCDKFINFVYLYYKHILLKQRGHSTFLKNDLQILKDVNNDDFIDEFIRSNTTDIPQFISKINNPLISQTHYNIIKTEINKITSFDDPTNIFMLMYLFFILFIKEEPTEISLGTKLQEISRAIPSGKKRIILVTSCLNTANDTSSCMLLSTRPQINNIDIYFSPQGKNRYETQKIILVNNAKDNFSVLINKFAQNFGNQYNLDQLKVYLNILLYICLNMKSSYSLNILKSKIIKSIDEPKNFFTVFKKSLTYHQPYYATLLQNFRYYNSFLRLFEGFIKFFTNEYEKLLTLKKAGRNMTQPIDNFITFIREKLSCNVNIPNSTINKTLFINILLQYYIDQILSITHNDIDALTSEYENALADLKENKITINDLRKIYDDHKEIHTIIKRTYPIREFFRDEKEKIITSMVNNEPKILTKQQIDFRLIDKQMFDYGTTSLSKIEPINFQRTEPIANIKNQIKTHFMNSLYETVTSDLFEGRITIDYIEFQLYGYCVLPPKPNDH